jgi:alkylhydroperoxidase family enzyme
LVVLRGQISDEGVLRVRAAGFDDAEIVEIVVNVALDISANYFNHVAGTEVDFPNVFMTLEHC